MRILVLDDDENILRMFRLFLRQNRRVEIQTAVTGQEGLHLMLRQFFHLVIVDVQMPVMDGIRFTEEIRKIWPWQEVMFCTGHLTEATRRRAAELGVKRILEKPLSLNTLQDEIEMTRFFREQDQLTGQGQMPPGGTMEALYAFQTASRQVLEHPDTPTWLSSAMDLLRRWVPWKAAAILLQHETEPLLYLEAQTGLEPGEFDRMEAGFLKRQQNLTGQEFRYQTHQRTRLPEAPGREILDLESGVYLPLTGRSGPCGLLMLIPREDSPLDPFRCPLLYFLTQLLCTLLQSLGELHEQGMKDPLTRLYNRRYLQSALQRAWQLSQRTKSPVGLMLIDLDTFKNLNDTKGHACGDEALRHVAHLLSESIRRSDLLVRLGGDEFLIVAPDTGGEGLRVLAERLRRLLNETQAPWSKTAGGISASFGCAVSLPSDVIVSPSQLIECADKAMYQAKQLGGNRVCSWVPGETGQLAPGPHPVLIVDDDNQVLQLIRRMLDKETYEVTGVTSVNEAEQLLISGRRFDLLLTDLTLPQKDGIEMLRIARGRDPLMMRLVITGNASRHTEESLSSLGVFSVITKPFHPNSLRGTLQKALDQRSALLRENR